MADLSLLLRRSAPRFAPDPRFDAAEPGAAVAEALAGPVIPDRLAEARDRAFAEGLVAGREEVMVQAAADGETCEKFITSLARLDAERTETFRQRLLDTVVALCEASLAPLALDVAALARRVERAAAMFVRADDERVIRVHPDDLEAVHPLLPPDWTFLPDPALARGALRIETATGGAEDGPAQWRQAITEAIALC